MREIYIKDKVAYLNEGCETINRIRRQCQSARIANILHDRMCEEHRRAERDFASFAYKFVSSELV